VITIHGDADTVAPYSHAVRLHEVLDRHRVANSLITIPGGQHGGFTRDQMIGSYEAIREFLAARGLRAFSNR
jgi:dipeptidyl aminopeptidase/acylaminoacyl peptidase